jgi:putative SOS response-associated peptidase YedK
VARRTTDANELMAPIHARMPVILPASAYDRWLDADEPADDLLSLLKRWVIGLRPHLLERIGL